MVEQKTIIRSKGRQRILIVDDGADTRLMLKLRLQRAGYTVSDADSGKQALQLLHQEDLPHLVILDILMPDIDGFAVARELRSLCQAPIIFLSALCDTNTKVEALNRYAEDYMTKPFDLDELVIRVYRVLERVSAVQVMEQDSVIDERTRINFAQHYIIVEGEKTRLTPIETRLIYLLYIYRGHVLSPDFLIANTWDAMQTCTAQTLSAHLGRLRSKIEPDPTHPCYIVTVHGQGYYWPK